MTAVERYEYKPNELRKLVLSMAHTGQTGHIACAFSLIEILSCLHEFQLSYPDNNPEHPDRDYLILSKGHGAMALYATHYCRGWIEDTQLENFYGDGTSLFGHPESNVSGMEVSTGSLGQGLGMATGIALGLKKQKKPAKVYCIVGDGEMNEGLCWEALQFAAHHKLTNLTVVLDANGFQGLGATKEIMNPFSWEKKFSAFGFETRSTDGHDLDMLKDIFDSFNSIDTEKPKALVANTIKGKGVSFMEGVNDWHYNKLSKETLAQALAELDR